MMRRIAIDGTHFETLESCHPSNREAVALKIAAAKNHEGKTLFDIIMSEILDKSDGYDHTLILDDED